MNINEKLLELINQQVTNEHAAALTYTQLSYDLDDLSLEGMTTWMQAQADEERVHAEKFATHLLARGYRPELGEFTIPDLAVKSPLDAFNHALAHEQKVTEQIRNIVRVADEVGDLESRQLLNWFLDEQVEEEDSISTIIDRIKMVGDNGSGLLRIDAELGAEREPAGGPS